MELDEMKVAWREMERRLAATEAAVEQLRVDRNLDHARAALRPLVARLGFELAQDVIAVLLFVAFLVANVQEPRFAVPAAALCVLVALAAASAIRQLGMVRHLDYAAPVSAVQRELADLRSLRLRTHMWVLLMAPLVWVPLLVVAARGLIGLDVYEGLGWPWVLSNLAFGLAFVIVAWVVSTWGRGFIRSSRWLTAIADDLAGRSLTRAMAQAREAAAFGAEP